MVNRVSLLDTIGAGTIAILIGASSLALFTSAAPERGPGARVAGGSALGDPQLDHDSARTERSVRWIEGLAGGLILPSDVLGRLRHQDPELSARTWEAWQHLRAIAETERHQRAVRWLGGLARSSLIPADVSGRLRAQDPDVARAVISAWSSVRALVSPWSPSSEQLQ
jgi:hypothetical protein